MPVPECREPWGLHCMRAARRTAGAAVQCLLFAILGCCAMSTALAQESPAEALARELEQLGQLAGRFTQTISEPGSAVAEVFSAGRFGLMRPGRFYWDIERPDSQLLVVNAGVLWHYDRDLQTATRRPLTDAATLPLQILAGDRAVLARDFEVYPAGDGAYRLVPRVAEAGFSELTLSLEDSLPVRMQLSDELGRSIDIRFSALSRTGLGESDFLFTPPPGVDVFRQGDDGG